MGFKSVYLLLRLFVHYLAIMSVSGPALIHKVLNLLAVGVSALNSRGDNQDINSASPCEDSKEAFLSSRGVISCMKDIPDFDQAMTLSLSSLTNSLIQLSSSISSSSKNDDQSLIVSTTLPPAMATTPSLCHTVLFSDIVASDSCKEQLFEHVVLPLTLPTDLKRKYYQGVRSTGNVLLYGPPGCGKTLLVNACANECNADLINVPPSDLYSKFLGDTEKKLKEIFARARNSRRNTIIFFDELDSIANSRGGTSDSESQSRRILTELLLQLNQQRDDIDDSHVKKKSKSNHDEERTQVVVIGATNRIEDIDEAIIRRFDVRLVVDPLETIEDRQKLIEHYLNWIEYDLSEKELVLIAKMCADFSNSDLKMLVKEAAMNPLRKVFSSRHLCYKKNSIEDIAHQASSSLVNNVVTKDVLPVRFSDFEQGFNRVMNASSAVPQIEEGLSGDI